MAHQTPTYRPAAICASVNPKFLELPPCLDDSVRLLWARGKLPRKLLFVDSKLYRLSEDGVELLSGIRPRKLWVESRLVLDCLDRVSRLVLDCLDRVRLREDADEELR